MIFGYVMVSTNEQNLDLQIDKINMPSSFQVQIKPSILYAPMF